MERVALYLLVVLGSHYLASFVQISLHWALGHRPLGGFLYEIHTREHHGIYSINALQSETYSKDEKSAVLYYVGPLVALGLIAYTLLPLDIFVVHLVSLSVSYAAHVYLHVQYHLTHAPLARLAWFRRKRALHLVHHRDESKNFAVIEFFWDRVFGTFEPVRP